MNARKRVELLFFVDLLKHVVEYGADDVRRPEPLKAIGDLLAVRSEVWENPPLPAGEADRILRRLARLEAETVAQYRVAGASVAGFGLLVYVMLHRLIEGEYLVFTEGSAFHRAVEIIMPALNAFSEENSEEFPKAEARALEALRAMQAGGYLRGFDVGGAT